LLLESELRKNEGLGLEGERTLTLSSKKDKARPEGISRSRMEREKGTFIYYSVGKKDTCRKRKRIEGNKESGGQKPGFSSFKGRGVAEMRSRKGPKLLGEKKAIKKPKKGEGVLHSVFREKPRTNRGRSHGDISATTGGKKRSRRLESGRFLLLRERKELLYARQRKGGSREEDPQGEKNLRRRKEQLSQVLLGKRRGRNIEKRSERKGKFISCAERISIIQ